MKRISNFILLILLSSGFFYRLYGLSNNYSFWSDENHVAIFVRAIPERGSAVLSNGYTTGFYQFLQYRLSSFSALCFSLDEFAIRFPSVIFGVLTIFVVYFLGRELFSREIGLISAFLISFLKIEILWSRQARPYQALQLFFLLATFFLFKLSQSKNFSWKYFLGFFFCGFLASLMHTLGFLIIFIGLVYIIVLNFKTFKNFLITLIILIFSLVVFFFMLEEKIYSLLINFGKVNHFYYYRIFLTHNYLFITINSFLGVIFLFLRRDYKRLCLLLLFIITQIFIVSFFLPMPFIRYFYIVFPMIILLSVFSLKQLSLIFNKKIISNFFLIFLIIFSVLSSQNKFVLAPQKSYSLNDDMQEIPEVDWKIIYNFVDKILDKNPESILIANWNDLPVWYLGEGELDYLLRENSFTYDSLSGAKIIHDLNSLENIINAEKKGIIVLDSWDDRVPIEIRNYIKENLRKELEINSLYQEQPRLWPVEVYSWGVFLKMI